ncbi:hypothetical protein [Streptomyces sp. NPDC127020]|uniref:hypothetical protein n=1 Tax=Streptomyces sp. NPDC127020 TaxID=3347109 RepID=UPI0036555B8F
MTTPASRAPRLLLTATLILTVAGAAMLTWPDQSGPREATAPARQAATFTQGQPSPSSSSAQPAARSTPENAAAPSSGRAPLPSGSVSALPPHGEGAAGDRAIQQALDAAWPADLNAVDERQLLTAGRALLCADATGVARGRWPAYFARQKTLAPAFATARFRVQAAIARQDGAVDRAVVHLVWAGTDRGGTHTDGRITDLHFTRTIPTHKEEEPAWIPQPGT